MLVADGTTFVLRSGATGARGGRVERVVSSRGVTAAFVRTVFLVVPIAGDAGAEFNRRGGVGAGIGSRGECSEVRDDLFHVG